jgi:hypothetical protein
MPRSEVTGAAVSRGFLRSNLTISFADGGTWEFEVSPFIRRTIVRIALAPGLRAPATGVGVPPGT